MANRQSKTMQVKTDVSIAETTTTVEDLVDFDINSMPNGITYTGLKAVLSFADPIQWNKKSTYDALTVVWDEASLKSYASKRPVPTGIELSNELYWFPMADGNAQIEMYRKEVSQYNDRISENTQSIQNLDTRIDSINSKILLIGDSWVASGKIGKYLTDNGYCDEVVTYGSPGAGFCDLKGSRGTSLNDMVNSCIAANEDSEQIKWVILIGGANNVSEAHTGETTANQVAQNIRDLGNALGKKYPGKVHVFATNCLPGGYKKAYSIAHLMSNFENTYYNFFYHHCTLYLANNVTSYNSGDGHPTNAGYGIFTYKCVQAILGNLKPTLQYYGLKAISPYKISGYLLFLYDHNSCNIKIIPNFTINENPGDLSTLTEIASFDNNPAVVTGAGRNMSINSVNPPYVVVNNRRVYMQAFQRAGMPSSYPFKIQPTNASFWGNYGLESF